MSPSGERSDLQESSKVKNTERAKFLLWVLITIGLGLFQVWVLLCIIWGLTFYPEQPGSLKQQNWGLAQILGNSVLLFFATSLLGQTIYTLSVTKVELSYRRLAAGLYILFSSVPFFILYILSVLFGESPVRNKYMFDILYAVQALICAAYVEFRVRTLPTVSAATPP